MEYIDNLSLQETEQLCKAYMDCRLTQLQEKELELVLLCSEWTSPIIEEVRDVMGMTAHIVASTSGSEQERRGVHRFLRYATIAASIAVIVTCSVYFFHFAESASTDNEVYACIDGKVLTGVTAQAIVEDIETETMNTFKDIIEQADAEQRTSQQFLYNANKM